MNHLRYRDANFLQNEGSTKLNLQGALNRSRSPVTDHWKNTSGNPKGKAPSHMSNEQNPDCLGYIYIGDYTTQLYTNFDSPLL